MSTMPLPDLATAALVISECQAGFVDPEHSFLGGLAAAAHERQIVPKIAALAETFRRYDRPVIHCTLVHRSDFAGVSMAAPIARLAHRFAVAVEGHPSAEIVEGLRPHPADIVCQRQSGATLFHNTDLESVLTVAGVDTLVLVGVSTNLALFAAAIEATNRNFRVVIPVDCTAGASEESHAAAVTHSLPLVAAMADSAAVTTALDELAASRSSEPHQS